MNEIEEITKAFAGSFPQKAEELKQSWENDRQSPNNSSVLSKQLHELAGSTGIYGFHDICEATQLAQQALHDLDNSDSSTLSLEDCVKNVIRLLKLHAV